MQVWPLATSAFFVEGEGTAGMSGPYYTVAEANAALLVVRELIATILNTRRDVLKDRAEVWPAIEKAAANGGNYRASELIYEFETVRRCLKEIRAMGIFVKDVNTGLVDFLSERDGDDIYLCWKYDEPEVAYWHTLEGGFAGRRRI